MVQLVWRRRALRLPKLRAQPIRSAESLRDFGVRFVERGRACAAPMIYHRRIAQIRLRAWRLLLVVNRHVIELGATGMRALLRESQRLAVF